MASGDGSRPRVLRGLVGCGALVLAAICGILALIGLLGAITSIGAANMLMAVVWAAVTLLAGWATIRLLRAYTRSEASAEAVAAAKAAGITDVAVRSTTARNQAAVRSSLLEYGAIGVSLVGVSIASLFGLTEEFAGAAIVMGASSAIAGLLLAASEGRKASFLRGAAAIGILSVAFVVWLILQGGEGHPDPAVVLGGAGLVLLVTAVPALGGFGLYVAAARLVRRAAAVHPSVAAVAAPPPGRDPELERATDHGRAAIVLRTYDYGPEGEQQLERERVALNVAGYSLQSVERSAPNWLWILIGVGTVWSGSSTGVGHGHIKGTFVRSLPAPGGPL